jgi:imidazolonepropionase-like amidohydrolase
MTMLPGLIDGHVHLAWDKSLYAPPTWESYEARLATRNPERDLLRAAHYAQMALAAGVTTVRDCGADDFVLLRLRDAIAAGDLVGPRTLVSGRPITTNRGHIWSGWGVEGGAQMREAVRLLAAKGVDFVKLVISGGTTTPESDITRSQYSLEEIRACVEEAHGLGLAVAAHAIATGSILLAAEAGVDTIEHCSWIGSDPRTTVTDERAVERMLENGVHVDHAIIPRPYQFAEECGGAVSEEEAWWLAMLRVRWPFLRHMRERGVTVFLGTDAVFGHWPGTPYWPGFQDMARAIEVMVRQGEFTASEAIAMATGEAARALGLEHEVGSIEPGKRADLILLAGDPFEDIRALREPEMVFRDGRLVARRGEIGLPGARTCS